MEGSSSVFKTLTRKPTGNGRPRHRWEEYIRIDLIDIDVNIRETGLIQLRIGIIGGPL